MISIREYNTGDLPEMTAIWNEVVAAGDAFPQEELLTEETAAAFFQAQSFSGVAVEEKASEILGLYILHPNHAGRCGHICNASYAVAASSRGRHIGEMLVKHCLSEGAKHGFRVLQFNAVVADNLRARRLYEKLGFQPLGVVPGGFRLKNGSYSDICLYYHTLV